MKRYRVEQKRPKDEQWYIVYCPEYSESEHGIAQWNDEDSYWRSEGLSTPIHDYVKAYYTTPLSKW